MNMCSKFSITASLFGLMFSLLLTGCGEKAPTDLRKYIPTDAYMTGYLDCERLLEHKDIASDPGIAAEIGENIHLLLRSIGFSNKSEHFSSCYFFAYDSLEHIALILEGKHVNQVLSNLPAGYFFTNIAGRDCWVSPASAPNRITYVLRLDENTIMVAKNMSRAIILAAVSGVGNNTLLHKIEKAENIACIRARKTIPCSALRAKEFQLEIIDRPEQVAVSAVISPNAPEDVPALMSAVSNLPLTQAAIISCEEEIHLYEPTASGLIAYGSDILKQIYMINSDIDK